MELIDRKHLESPSSAQSRSPGREMGGDHGDIVQSATSERLIDEQFGARTGITVRWQVCQETRDVRGVRGAVPEPVGTENQPAILGGNESRQPGFWLTAAVDRLERTKAVGD